MRSMSINELQEVNGGTTYRCPFCGYRSTSFWNMVAHIILEVGKASYIPPLVLA